MMHFEINNRDFDAQCAYIAFLDTAAGQRAVGLMRTHKMSLSEVLEAVEAAVSDVLPVLMHNALYSAEQLCGPELWDRLRFDGARRVAGMCLAFLVECQAVPLVVHWTSSGNGPKRYLLDSTWVSVNSFGGGVSY